MGHLEAVPTALGLRPGEPGPRVRSQQPRPVHTRIVTCWELGPPAVLARPHLAIPACSLLPTTSRVNTCTPVGAESPEVATKARGSHRRWDCSTLDLSARVTPGRADKSKKIRGKAQESPGVPVK